MLTNEEILSRLVPDAYVSKITLETIGGRPTDLYDNPHIDLESKPSFEEDLRTGKKLIFTSPRSDRKQNPTPETLNITVDLLMKEKVKNDLVGSWFKNKNFSKFIKLKVILSTKEQFTSEATHNFDVLKNVTDSDSVQERVLSVDRDILGDGSNTTGKYEEKDQFQNTIINYSFRTQFNIKEQHPEHLAIFVFSYIDLKMLAEEFKFKLDFSFMKEPMGKISSELVMLNGEIVSETSVYLKEDGTFWLGEIREFDGAFFGLNGTNAEGSRVPLRREVVSNSKIQDFRNFNDLERLILDFTFLETEVYKLDINRPDPASKSAIDSVFTEMFLARDEDGDARFAFGINYKKLLELNSRYPGLFVRKESAKQAITSAPMVFMKIFRRRIKGSAEIGSEYIKDSKFDENQVDDIIVLSGEKTYQNFTTQNHKNGSLREITSVGTEKAFDDNMFGLRFFTGVDKTMSEVTDGYYVYGVELEVEDSSYSFLVDKFFELRNARTELENYYEESTRLTSNRILVQNSNPHIDFDGERNIDRNEMIIGNFDPYLNRFTEKFINRQLRLYGEGNEPWIAPIRTYVEILQLLSSQTDKLNLEKYLNILISFCHPSTGNPYGIHKILKLIETMEWKLSRDLGITVMPSSAGLLAVPSAIPSVRGEKLNMLQRMSQMDTRKGSFTSIKTFKVSKLFDSVFNSNIPNSYGTDFLGIEDTPDKIDGLKVISGEEYNKRTEKETDIYFERPNGLLPDINISNGNSVYTSGDSLLKTSFSYLSPATVKLDSDVLKRLGRSPVPKINKVQFSSTMQKIKLHNTYPVAAKKVNTLYQKKETSKDSVKSIAKTLPKIFELANVQVLSKKTLAKPSLSDAVYRNLPRKPELIDPLPSIIESHCEIEESSKTEEEAVNSSLVLLMHLANNSTLQKTSHTSTRKVLTPSANSKTTIESFNLKNTSNVVEKLIQNPSAYKSESFFQGKKHNTTLNEAMSKLPNQVKSLFLAGTNPQIVKKNVFLNGGGDKAATPEDSAEFKFDYNMLQTVLVLRGFRMSSLEEPLMKSPNWEPLTVDIYNDSTGEALICKLKPYENKEIGILRDSAGELPPYNEYFIIRPERTVQPQKRETLRPPISKMPPRIPPINVGMDVLNRHGLGGDGKGLTIPAASSLDKGLTPRSRTELGKIGTELLNQRIDNGSIMSKLDPRQGGSSLQPSTIKSGAAIDITINPRQSTMSSPGGSKTTSLPSKEELSQKTSQYVVKTESMTSNLIVRTSTSPLKTTSTSVSTSIKTTTTTTASSLKNTPPTTTRSLTGKTTTRK